MDELVDMFSDEWFEKVFAASVVDGEGRADRRTAKICESNNTTAYNVANRNGAKIADDLYRTEESYMPPAYVRRPIRRKQQTWGEMRKGLGFK